MTLEEEAAYHEAGHAVLHIACGKGDLLQYVSILQGPDGQVGGTSMLEAQLPYAPADGRINMARLMIALAGAVAEEIVGGLSYGADGQAKSDYAQARRWASRDGELPEGATQVNLERGWAEAKQHLMLRWSHVKALAEALLERKVMSGGDVIALLLDVPRVPYAEVAR